MNTVLKTALAAAGFGALCVAAPAVASTEESKVLSLCEVEVDADEIGKPQRRTETVGFMKRVDGQVAVIRPTLDGVEEIKGEVGMDLFALDAVVTGSNDGFDDIFTDNSTVSGIADTCIEISKYAYNAA